MTAFFYLFILSRTFFFCIRRSRFDVGARENGLGARPNFFYAGKTLHTVPQKLHCIKHTNTFTAGWPEYTQAYKHTHTHTHPSPLTGLSARAYHSENTI